MGRLWSCKKTVAFPILLWSSFSGEELAIFTPDGKEHQLEQSSIERLGVVDMAVLTFSSGGAYEVATVGDIKKVKHDQTIYVAG